MFNISGVELAVILLVALILLGPQRLPELARGLGKFLREFRHQTDEVRTMVEREFYQMDQEIQKVVEPVASPSSPPEDGPALNPPDSSAAFSSAASSSEASSSPDAPGTILPPAGPGGAAALASSDPSGATGELYDAEYHAAEANGLLPPTREAEPAATEDSPATPRVADLQEPVAPQPPSSSEHQEPTPRAK